MSCKVLCTYTDALDWSWLWSLILWQCKQTAACSACLHAPTLLYGALQQATVPVVRYRLSAAAQGTNGRHITSQIFQQHRDVH